MIAATYDPTLFWIGFVLVLLGLLVQLAMWWAARKKAQEPPPQTEDLVEDIIKAILKLIEKGLYGVAITLVGLVLMVASLSFGDDDEDEDSPGSDSIALRIDA